MKKILIYVFAGLVVLGIIGSLMDDGSEDNSQSETKSSQNNSQSGTRIEETELAMSMSMSIEKALGKKDYSTVKERIAKFAEKHPSSPKNEEYKKLIEDVKEKEILLEETKKLEELNKTGNWNVKFYQDDFGNTTNVGYIDYSKTISGKYTGPIVDDGDIEATLALDKEKASIFLVTQGLLGQAVTNSMGPEFPTKYAIKIQDNNRKQYSCSGIMNSDRILIYSPEKLYEALEVGGKVMLVIQEIEAMAPSKYNITIDNTDYFRNAFRKLSEK